MADAGRRRVEVTPERLPGWVERFADRHGETAATATRDGVVLTADDGATASLGVPWGEWHGGDDPLAELVNHVTRPRVLGILLVRRPAYAVGVLDDATLVDTKVGTRYVQGKTKAGGRSQRRFAQRREEQARAAFGKAADTAAAVLLPHRERLEGLSTGGDRRAVAAVLADPRLRPLTELPQARFLAVPDPRRRVLDDAARRARSVVIDVTDPPGSPGSPAES